MSCRKTQKLMSAYMDGELAEREISEVRAHLASCVACQRRLARHQQIEKAYAATGKPSAPEDFVEQVQSRIASGEAPRELEPVSAQVVWNALFRPAYVKVPLQVAAVAMICLVAFIMTRPDYYPPVSPDGSSRIAGNQRKGGAQPPTGVAAAAINRIELRVADPGAAAIVTQAVAQSCMGSTQFVRRESSNEGKVWILAVELPQNQVAVFQNKLAEAQKASSAGLFHPPTGQVAQEPPKDFVPGIEDIVNKGIGAAAVTITPKTDDGSRSVGGTGGIPKDQPKGRTGMVTVEVEIRSIESQK